MHGRPSSKGFEDFSWKKVTFRRGVDSDESGLRRFFARNPILDAQT